MNRWVLQATLTERAAVRYTPAGLPALDVVLSHLGQASEDGQTRQLAFATKAVAIGDITRRLQVMALDTPAVFAGFISASRNGRGLRFHITSIDATE
jgi:primosomal replication protein N